VSFSLMTGTGAQRQQRIQGAAGIQVAAALLGVAEGQQHCATVMACASSNSL
jgi:hypothetical protein